MNISIGKPRDGEKIGIYVRSHNDPEVPKWIEDHNQFKIDICSGKDGALYMRMDGFGYVKMGELESLEDAYWRLACLDASEVIENALVPDRGRAEGVIAQYVNGAREAAMKQLELIMGK
jgi:hypothetical protein